VRHWLLTVGCQRRQHRPSAAVVAVLVLLPPLAPVTEAGRGALRLHGSQACASAPGLQAALQEVRRECQECWCAVQRRISKRWLQWAGLQSPRSLQSVVAAARMGLHGERLA